MFRHNDIVDMAMVKITLIDSQLVDAVVKS